MSDTLTIAVIPARGGSKRIPRKNIRPFLGVPLIVRPITTLLNSNLFDYVVLSILIAIGGTDVLGIAGDVASALRDRFDGRIIAATDEPATGVERAPADIALSLASCDVAVIGGGSTMWESCLLGTPSIAVIVADNQADAAADAAVRGVCDIVDCRDDRDPTRIVEAVLRLMGSPERRSSMSASGMALVDGAGAERVADSLTMRLAA